MRPVSGAMLLVAAALSSPALAGAVMGSVPVDVALERYLVVAGVCWALLAFAADWIWSPATDPAAATAQASTSAATSGSGAEEPEDLPPVG